MAIIRYPGIPGLGGAFREMARIQREMDRLFGELMGKGPAASTSGVFPALNVMEDASKIHVQAELPGISAEDLEISVEGKTLTLGGARKLDAPEGVSYHRRERKAGRFHKALTLPYEINTEGVAAEFKDGVLKLVLPKAEEAKPRKIAIKAE